MSDVRDSRQVLAMVHHCGDESISLQIDLPNDKTVLLTVSRTDGASVSLFHGSGQLPFEDYKRVEGFRHWLAEASFGQGVDLDVQAAENEKIIELLFEAPRSLEQLVAATHWPPVYLQGVLYRLVKHEHLPVIEERDGRFQLTDWGCSAHLIRLRHRRET